MKITFWMLLIWAPLVVAAQGRPVPITVSLFNEATAIPFTKLVTLPIHPGIQVGTEFDYQARPHSRLFQTANVGYFYHGHLNQGIALSTELGYEYRVHFGLALAARLGLGYMHTFATTKEYVFQHGQYLERSDRGNARLFPSLSLDLGYYLRKGNVHSPLVFLRYQAWVEYPYSPGFIPVMTHINLHVGAKFFLPFSKTPHEKH